MIAVGGYDMRPMTDNLLFLRVSLLYNYIMQLYIEPDGGLMNENKFFSTRNITYLAVLLALVILFQVLARFMHVGNASFCLVLIPIVLGGMLLGPIAGGLLGLAFALVVIFADILGDPMSMIILKDHPFLLIFSTLLRGAIAGVVPALLFRLVSKKNKRVATFVAAASAPVINTGIFILSMLIMSGSVVKAMGEDAAGHSAIYIIVIWFVGINFFIELGLNLVLSPMLYTVHNVIVKRIEATA